MHNENDLKSYTSQNDCVCMYCMYACIWLVCVFFFPDFLRAVVAGVDSLF